MHADLVGPFEVVIGDYPDTSADLDTSVLRGVITDVVLKHTFDNGTSMDIAITTSGDTLPSKDILGISGSNTDAWYAVREQLVDTDGAALTDLYNAGVTVYDSVNIAISNGGAGDKLQVWFLVQ